jgi:hypothetical protein
MRKYALYAVGEIALVVIGILIALQINNWNEDRILKEKEIINLIEIRDNLKSDLENELNPSVIEYETRNQNGNVIRQFYLSPNSPSADSISRFLRSFSEPEWRFIFKTFAFENLKSIGIDLISNDSLRSNISSIYSYDYKEIASRGSKLSAYYIQQVSPVMNKIIDKFDYKILSTSEISQIKNNFEIKNILLRHISLRILLLNDLKNVQENVEKLILEIQKELDKLKHT